jgi:hypothetical protein
LRGGLVAPDELETLLDAHNPTGLPRLESPIADGILFAMIPGDDAVRRRMYQTRAAGRGMRSGGRGGAAGRGGSGSGAAKAQAAARQSLVRARGREVHMPLSTTRELRRWFPRWASDGGGAISVRAMLGQREMENGHARDEFIAQRQAALRVIHNRRAELTTCVDEPVAHGGGGGGVGGAGAGAGDDGIEIGGNMDDWL